MSDLLHGTATHKLRELSRTNACNVVPICTCGWIGSVHPSHRRVASDGRRGRRVYKNADAAALMEYRKHAAG